MQQDNGAAQRKDYEKFIRSPAWAEKKRLFALTRDWPVCFKCGAWDVPMDVHHLTYARFGGDELMEDLEYVCRPCHYEIHKAAIIKRMIQKKTGQTSKARRRKKYKQKRKERKDREAARLERVAKYLSEKQ